MRVNSKCFSIVNVRFCVGGVRQGEREPNKIHRAVQLCNGESAKCSVIEIVWHMMDGRMSWMSHIYIF